VCCRGLKKKRMEIAERDGEQNDGIHVTV